MTCFATEPLLVARMWQLKVSMTGEWPSKIGGPKRCRDRGADSVLAILIALNSSGASVELHIHKKTYAINCQCNLLSGASIRC